MDSVKLIKLPQFENDLGDLVVFESQTEKIPFKIKRVFNVRSPKNCLRGQHAHKECNQLLICANGAIEVKCDNGFKVSKYSLDESNLGLLIPAGVWSEQKYLENNSILTVLCDQKYSEDDYLRDYKLFLAFVKNTEQEKTNE